MSKVKARVNKSAEIRELHANFPTMGPSKMSEYLATKGIKATAATISTVLSTAKKRGGKIGKPGRPTGTKNRKRRPGEALPIPADIDIKTVGEWMGDLVAVLKLTKRLGGAKNMQAMLDTLKQVELV